MKPTRLFCQARRITTVVIGGGQSGLAASCCLAERGIDHVVLERAEIANAWRSERWDSLRLLTPNWQCRLPGHHYDGDDPDGFMTMNELVEFISGYARSSGAPVQCHTRVTEVTRTDDGYRVTTDHGAWQCRTLVIASGACNTPVVPEMAAALPGSIYSLTPHRYRNPGQLPDGGVLVVGAAASGLQIADEIQRSGRQVILSAGEHVRMPRRYRGRDILFWMDKIGMLDERYDQVDDIRRARRLPSAQLVGSPERRSLDLNTLIDRGVEVVGRAAAVNGSTLQFSGSLANIAKLADLKQGRLLQAIDDWIGVNGCADEAGAPDRPGPTRVASSPRLQLDLARGEIRTIIWATGFRPDYPWLRVPVLDHRGRIVHDGGVTEAPGLYVMGLPFMRRRKSSFIYGVADDARDIVAHLGATLAQSRMKSRVGAA